jgi:hypothetical protein
VVAVAVAVGDDEGQVPHERVDRLAQGKPFGHAGIGGGAGVEEEGAVGAEQQVEEVRLEAVALGDAQGEAGLLPAGDLEERLALGPMDPETRTGRG